MWIKVCGFTRVADARHAAEVGATAVGLVFWPRSPRCVDVEQAAEIVAALPAGVTPVGVFVNATPAVVTETVDRVGLRAVQFHGDEAPAAALGVRWPVLRSATVGDAAAVRAAWPAGTLLLLDAPAPERRGGTGRQVDWTAAAAVALEVPTVLAGGLTPDNVGDAVTAVRPHGVDVSSGVETAPGIKDGDKVARFVERARHALEDAARNEMRTR
jgi:phosphoribosylanthranilate isomerase